MSSINIRVIVGTNKNDTINIGTTTVGTDMIFGGNGVDTIKAKTQFAIDRGIGGVMIWELGQDYFNDDGSYDQSVSLLPAIKQVVYAQNGTGSNATGTIAGNSHVTANPQRNPAATQFRKKIRSVS